MQDVTMTRRAALRMAAIAATTPSLVAWTRGAESAAAAAAGSTSGLVPRNRWIAGGWAVKPFALNQVALGDGVFRQKRDRILHFARSYPETGGVLDGPNRMLVNFRANAGLPTMGFQPPGAWDSATANLRGHYSGHFMTLLAQAYADTGEQVFKQKLDYMVAELAKCLQELDQRPLGRVPGRFGNALKLGGVHPNQYVTLPTAIVRGLTDVTIAAWVNPAVTQDGARLFHFGAGNDTYMSLTTRVSNAQPYPSFAIRTAAAGEQRIDGSMELPPGQWTHVAVTLSAAEATGRLYVNGREVGARTGMTLSPSSLGETTGNWIGRSQANNSHPFLNAAVDEFQIRAAALAEDEIRELLVSAGGEPQSLVAWYRFEADGQVAGDHSGGGRDADIVGAGYRGYLAAYPEGQFIRLEPPLFQTNNGPNAVWASWYTFHKIVRGLLDAHELTGNEQALEIAFRMGDWAHERLSRISRADLDRMWNIYSAGETGGANEVMAELSALAPDADRSAGHLEAAKAFDFSTMLEATRDDRDILNGRHGNTFVPPMLGHLRIFELTGESDYLTSARNFWGMIVPHRLWSNGGTSGPGEFFRQRDVIAGHLRSAGTGTTFAETCTAYNMLKLSRNLFFHTVDPAYMDYYEKGLCNQILGSKRDIDSGRGPWVTYHQNMFPGASRQPDYTRYVGTNGLGSCCTGSGPENHTKYQESIYFRSADETALYVNLFISSTLTWVERGFVIVQESEYPTVGEATLRFVEGSGPLALKLRVPAWVRKGFVVEVNGAKERVDAAPGTYATVSRNWSPGDEVRIRMPFSFRVERTPDDPTVQSIYYGPALMTTQGGAAPPIQWRRLSLYASYTLDGDFSRAFAPAQAPMHFTTQGYDVAPFYVADPQQYTAYHAYFERYEPEVVFGTVRTRIENRVREDGLSFLDVVWDEAPFKSHGPFVSTVAAVASDFRRSGLFTNGERSAIVSAAGRAARELRP